MSDLYWLTDEQMARLKPCFPNCHGKPRVDDRRVWSEIIVVDRNRPALARRAGGLWPSQDPPQSLEAVERGGRLRTYDGGPVWRSGRTSHGHDHATYLKAHRRASSLREKKGALGG
ncbi:IS5 family transposase [Brevundimonas intermedia]|uniref:IS5 family transposase n=1 Tax=Brevundimonas intermedia TaxID=74315 RepID=A0ABQ5T944_9CAUL|nr:IS5 family transposase [Brevundimonas intermedia]